MFRISIGHLSFVRDRFLDDMLCADDLVVLAAYCRQPAKIIERAFDDVDRAEKLYFSISEHGNKKTQKRESASWV
jgi:hypothetical protein